MKELRTKRPTMWLVVILLSATIVMGGSVLVIVSAESALTPIKQDSVELPIHNLGEVNRDKMRHAGNTFPKGWQGFYADYKLGLGAMVAPATPFSGVAAFPAIQELLWVQALAAQDQQFESDEFAQQQFDDLNHYPKKMVFQVFVWADRREDVEKNSVRFVYRDSTGQRSDGTTILHSIDTTKGSSPLYRAVFHVLVALPPNPLLVNWFSLHVFHIDKMGRIDMKWVFQPGD